MGFVGYALKTIRIIRSSAAFASGSVDARIAYHLENITTRGVIKLTVPRVEGVLVNQTHPATVNTLVGVMIAGEREKSTNQVCFQGKLFRLNMSKTKGVNFLLAVFVTAHQKSLTKERLTKEILIGESIGSVNADIVDIHVTKCCRVGEREYSSVRSCSHCDLKLFK